MMYKAIFKIQPDCIDVANQRIFTPFINCYELHSSFMRINGLMYEEQIDYTFDRQYTNSAGELHTSDSVIFELNYFYIKKHDIEILGFLVGQTYVNPNQTKNIVSSHYVEGQFSLDNGLYKNAVLNFGTTLEGLLNTQLSNIRLVDLINTYNGQANTTDMHAIRTLRNKVHPNQISQTQDLSRAEAIETRNKLENILRMM